MNDAAARTYSPPLHVSANWHFTKPAANGKRGIEVTNTLDARSRTTATDARGAHEATRRASAIAAEHRLTVDTAMERLVGAKRFVSDGAQRVRALALSTAQVTGFIAVIRELAVQSAKGAKNGQIVVARLGDEVTVKRFMRNKNLIELHPENPDYQTIVVEPGEPFEIEGLAVGLIRNTMLM